MAPNLANKPDAVNYGLSSKFSIVRIDTVSTQKEATRTLSDKTEIGLFLGKRVEYLEPYIKLGGVYLEPSKEFSNKKTWGGHWALGLKLSFGNAFGFALEQSVNFRLDEASELSSNPNLFNTSTFSLGFLMSV